MKKKKVECSTCHAKEHLAEAYFMTNLKVREEFLKRQPELRNKIEKRVLDFKRDG